MEIKTVKTVIGYAAHARLCATLEEGVGFVRRFVATPYRSGPVHEVYGYRGLQVIVAETAHRTYKVIAVPAGLELRKTDEEATVDYLALCAREL